MAAPSQLVGQTLSHYRILEQIGAGGMGVVYRAHDEQLERDVAVKVLPVGTLADEATRKRFRKEALALAKLNHPNIATIFEFSSQDSTDYLVTEYISGQTLDEKLAAGVLSEKEVIGLGIQLAQGLSAAHAHGIVHRDLKPANLRLTSDGRLKILDFGLAQLMPHASEVGMTATLTQSQEVTGTLPYMAPEQLRGEPAEARTDIWAAGAVLYEMATAHRPFGEKVATALAADIIHKAPPSPRSMKSELSSKLEAVILKCLEKEQAKRYQSARDLQSDLERLGTGVTPIAAQLQWRWSIIAAIVIVVLCSAAASWYLLRRRVGRSTDSAIHARRSVAVLGFKNLSGKPEVAWLSTALSEMITTELGAGEKLRTVPGENVARMKIDLVLPETDSLAADTLAKVYRNLGSDLVVLGSYLDLGGQVRLDLHLQDATKGETLAAISETGSEGQLLDLVNRAGTELRTKCGAEEITPAETAEVKASVPSNPEAARLYAEGLAKLRFFDASGARDLLEKATAADANFALAHSALAEAWSDLGYNQKAREEAEKAFDLSGNLSRESRLVIEGRYRESIYDWDKAFEAYKSLYVLFSDNLEYGLHLAQAQDEAGKSKDALATLRLLRKLPLPSGEDPRIDLNEADVGIEGFEDVKQVQALAAKAAAKATALGARRLVAEARTTEGRALQQENLDLAQARYEDAKTIYAALGDKGGMTGPLIMIGQTSYRRGELARAKVSAQQALAIAREIGFTGQIPGCLNVLGNVLIAQGDLAGAKAASSEALQLDYQLNSKYLIKDGLWRTSRVLFHEGKLPQAKQMLQRSLAIDPDNKFDQAVFQIDTLAPLLIEEGNGLDAAAMVRDAKKQFGKGGESMTVDADIVLARALLTLGKPGEARAEIDQATSLLANHQDRLQLLRVAIEDARVEAALGKPEEATNKLQSALSETANRELVELQFEARLALGEIEMKSGQAAVGRARLKVLERDAKAKGFLLIARKAAAARKG